MLILVLHTVGNWEVQYKNLEKLKILYESTIKGNQNKNANLSLSEKLYRGKLNENRPQSERLFKTENITWSNDRM